MPKRGENIYKRKDARWEARYIKGYDTLGTAQYGYIYAKTYSEVKDKLAEIKVKLYDQSKRVPNTFGEYCDEWLTLSRNRVKESTYVKYYGIVNTRLKPGLGSLLPEELNTIIIEKFSNNLLIQVNLSPKTVRDILTVLHAVIDYGRKQRGSGFIEMDIIYPQSRKSKMRVLSNEEQYRLVQYLMTDMDYTKFGILLALFTGMRIGEICALRWEDIYIEDKFLHVCKTMQRLQKVDEDNAYCKTKIVIGDAKSDTSIRDIPLNEHLAEICKIMSPDASKAYVLTGKVDVYLDPRTLQYRFSRVAYECGLEGAHFHTLRHTFATRCIESGFEIKSLSEVLGHASTKVTLDRYVHSSMDLKRINMDKLPAYGL
ncbi:MAG: site-specific integrase [Lachnospiraceae bacterium]|nr:site-specific integrase [Lachnospiraceae bacterium]